MTFIYQAQSMSDMLSAINDNIHLAISVYVSVHSENNTILDHANYMNIHGPY